MVRYGVIGIGNMGSAHARALYEGRVSGAELTCVADIEDNKLKWAKENLSPEVSLYNDYESLISSGLVDAVLIATPHYLHPVIAKRSFEKGINVLSEKPSGVDASDVKEMNEAAKRSGKAFGIMFNQRTNMLFRMLKYYISIGMLGDIKRFNWIINNWYRTQAYYESSSWRASWNGEGGGVLLNQCPHNIDIWQWIMGMPDKIMAFCNEGHFHNIAVEDDVTIYAQYRNGATATFITSTGEYPGTNRLEISGTMGKAVAEDGKLKLSLLNTDERTICFKSEKAMPTEPVSEIVICPEDEEDGHVMILKNFTEHILNKAPLIAPGEEGINSLTISNAAYLSSWTKSEVNIDYDKELFTKLLSEKKMQEKMTEKNSKGLVEIMGDYNKRWSVNW